MRTARLLFALLFAAGALAATPGTERLPGLDTVHGHLDNGRGTKVQTILTRPLDAAGRLPALLLVQWLSCDGSEVLSERLSGMNELVRRLAIESGMVMLRVEKPGIGTSEGKCDETDFQTELAAYQAGLALLRQHPWVDPKRIALVGMSNGGGVAPLVAADAAAYVVVNGWSKTWFEHMMESLRREAEWRGGSPAEVSTSMRAYAELYAEYLQEKKLPGDIVKAKPHLARYWTEPPAHQWGRPAAFYQQLQELNLAEAWSKVRAPALVVWGEHDWIMGRDDHERIVDLVNRNRAGAAQLLVVPRMHHDVRVHETRQQALTDYWSGHFPEELPGTIIRWLRERL